MRKLKIIIYCVLIGACIYLVSIKPRKVSCNYPPYFNTLNQALKAQHPGASAGIIDLDRLDSNMLCVRNILGKDFKLRLVTKSLPSLDLLRYLMQAGNTNRLMVFSEPFIAEILNNCNADSLDILLGKPLPAEVLPRLSVNKGFSAINWLVDTKERLNQYLAFAKKDSMPLKISLEIDVGLHRGGFETMQQFDEAIEIIQQNKQYLQLTGLMGYDGHVPYVPFYVNKQRAINKAFVNVQNSYTQFVEELKKHYYPAYISTLTFNGGGSHTYYYYPKFKNLTPVNDIAMGSGFLAPEQFSDLNKLGHKAALFLSSPVLKKIESSLLPHAEKISPLVNLWDPNLKVSYYMLGGGWPGEPVAPAGIKKNYFWDENDLGYTNLLPNQSILSSSDENNLNVGDFVFYHAWEGDGMLSFNKIELYRQGKIVGEWNTYKGGN
jgi:D-serine deaminase-like pyridoxal phosphate-dependent protein